jgi:hypothetical protein
MLHDQAATIEEALELAAASKLYKDKNAIITAVVDSTGAPRPTVRRVKGRLLKKLKEKVKILEE